MKIFLKYFSLPLLIAVVASVLYVVDCFVSYRRGRGFLRGYGHRIHTYGRVNPHYRRAANAHAASNSGRGYGGGSRGCACACACACAGGGRAGCSRKDTKEVRPYDSVGELSNSLPKKSENPIVKNKKV